MSALPQEQGSLRHLLHDARTVRLAGRDFLLGSCGGREVVMVLSGIGKVAAATTAAVLLERFGASEVVFTGVAGGLGAGVARGDLVIAQAFAQHDMDASPLFPRHEVPLYGRVRFDTDAGLSQRLLQGAAVLAREGVTVHHGLIASGDQFIASHAASDELRARLPDVLAVEMEGGAVAQVCHDYGVPFAAMRSISDRADDNATHDFQHFLHTVASRYADALISHLLHQNATT